ncbi:MAG: phenylacetate--CoA ligase family protein [Phycisphaerae bacterium]|nr:phenylacetate--CoA ligase family protein [Phycisphaerae bacterium]
MSPLLVRKLLLPAHELLLGRRTLRYLRELEASQRLPIDRLRTIQVEKLRALLTHAARNCPYYRDAIHAAGVQPQNATLHDLTRLPTLTKNDIRRHAQRLLESPRRRRLAPYCTGGSSGDPLQFWIDRDRQAADQAARARSRRWFGIDLGEREAYLWGAPVELAAQDRLKRVRDRLTNQLLLDAFRMTLDGMTDYLRRIRRFDPVHLFGYPSSLARLARHACDAGWRLQTPSLKAVFVTGELLLPEDRAAIEAAAQVPVADGYGSREAGFIAHQCRAGRYHVTMESLIVELLGDDLNPVSDGQSGEVTITHLDALGMPFIRYRTGDFARRASGACPCGRELESLERIEGRRTDMLRTADGGYAHALSVIYALRDVPAIRHFRVEQRENLDLAVQIIADDSLDEARRALVTRHLRNRIGEGPRIELRVVDEIPQLPSGKHRCVVSAAAE